MSLKDGLLYVGTCLPLGSPAGIRLCLEAVRPASVLVRCHPALPSPGAAVLLNYSPFALHKLLCVRRGAAGQAGRQGQASRPGPAQGSGQGGHQAWGPGG